MFVEKREVCERRRELLLLSLVCNPMVLEVPAQQQYILLYACVAEITAACIRALAHGKRPLNTEPDDQLHVSAVVCSGHNSWHSSGDAGQWI